VFWNIEKQVLLSVLSARGIMQNCIALFAWFWLNKCRHSSNPWHNPEHGIRCLSGVFFLQENNLTEKLPQLQMIK
jgi:hypothetical protein